MCPCGKLGLLVFLCVFLGGPSGFKVRKVTVASTTILTFFDLLNVEDRVAYLDSWATGACWQKAHHAPIKWLLQCFSYERNVNDVE